MFQYSLTFHCYNSLVDILIIHNLSLLQQFHLEQAKLRSKIRVKDGRGKTITSATDFQKIIPGLPHLQLEIEPCQSTVMYWDC